MSYFRNLFITLFTASLFSLLPLSAEAGLQTDSVNAEPLPQARYYSVAIRFSSVDSVSLIPQISTGIKKADVQQLRSLAAIDTT